MPSLVGRTDRLDVREHPTGARDVTHREAKVRGMSVDGWKTLVLGGIRSGKSEFAEALVRDTVQVRYLATAASRADDPEWSLRIERHRTRRPASWTVEEIGDNPSRLAQVIAAASPAETLLVDDLGGWVSVLLDPTHQPADDGATIAELAAAIRDCPARLVLVSPEVGLTMVPLTPLGRAFTDALGATNQAVADACDAVVLVVAGQPCWLKPAPIDGGAPTSTATATPTTAVPAASAVAAQSAPTAPPVVTAPPAPTAPPVVTAPPLPPVASTLAAANGAVVAEPEFKVGMDLPMPDETAGWAALDRLGTLDFPGAGLGHLDRVVRFAAATQGTPTPAPWHSVRVLLIHGDHAGGAAAGTVPGESARRADEARSGAGPIATLAAQVGATLEVVPAPSAAAMEEAPVLSAESVESALRYGWQVVARAAADGVQVLVLAACGAGADAAAAAVLATTARAEPAAVLGRVIQPGGRIDDPSWMIRCAAVRDALHRTRHSRRDAKDVLAELAGGDIAVATGILLGAAAHRVPVLLDGPVGIAAGLVSRDLGGQARHWCLLPDHNGHPGVRLGAEMLDLDPLLDLRLGVGEGASALAALPLLRSALLLAATAPEPASAAEPAEDQPDGDQPAAADATDATDATDGAGESGESGDEEFVEPEPAGPGPARTAGPGA